VPVFPQNNKPQVELRHGADGWRRVVQFHFWRSINSPQEGGEFLMTLRYKAVMLVLVLSSIAFLVADWGWGP
jgi:hypothetical protein